MQIKIDVEKLEQILMSELEEIQSMPALDETRVCLTDMAGMQIHLVITREENDFFDAYPEQIITVEE